MEACRRWLARGGSGAGVAGGATGALVVALTSIFVTKASPQKIERSPATDGVERADRCGIVQREGVARDIDVADGVHRHVHPPSDWGPLQRGVHERRAVRVQFGDERVGAAVQRLAGGISRRRIVRGRGAAGDPGIARAIEVDAAGAFTGGPSKHGGVDERRTGGVELRREVVAPVRRRMQCSAVVGKSRDPVSPLQTPRPRR